MPVDVNCSTQADQNVAERVGFEPTVVLPTHAFQACALNHSAISPTVFSPAPNRMVIRQWTLIFHEFAPGASSFGAVAEGMVPRTALPACDRPRSQRCPNVKAREKLETVIGKHAIASLVGYSQMPYPTRNRDKILWTKGKLRNKVILMRKIRNVWSGRKILG
jgi:hypothetical protein